MCIETNETRSTSHQEKAQIWIIGSREQVQHLINEFCAVRLVSDRALFSPIIAAPCHPGRYMVIVERGIAGGDLGGGRPM